MMEVTRRRSYTHKPAHRTAVQCPPGQARRRSSEARQLCPDRWLSRTCGPRRPRGRPSGTRTANDGPPGLLEAAWAAHCQQQQQEQQQNACRSRAWEAEAEPWPHLPCRRRQRLLQLLQPPPPPSARRSSGCACAGGTRSRRASCHTCCTASGRCTGPSSGGTARRPWGSSPSRSQQRQQHPAACADGRPRGTSGAAEARASHTVTAHR